MKCKDFEQQIYLYAELSEIERTLVDSHVSACSSCKELFQLVSSTQKLIVQASEIKAEIVNHSRLTSSIMQAVSGEQKQPASWINNLFVKYAMVAASLALVTTLSLEQLPSDQPYKRLPAAKTVTLNSSSLMKAVLDRKENPSPNKTSLYACVKKGDCNSTIIENFKKKAL